MKRLFVFFAVLVLVSAGCAPSSSSSTSDNGGGGGGGSVGPGTFRFEPGTAYASPGDTISFQLLDGTAPYQFGYVDPSDIQSYDDPSQIQATFDSNTGVGSYTVGPNTDCTDRLAAADADDNIVYLTITVGQSGGGGGGGTGAGSGGSGGQTGTYWAEFGGRNCLVEVPSSYNQSIPSPLMIVYHGNGGDPVGHSNRWQWDSVAEANRIIVVYPQGSNLGGYAWDHTSSVDIDMTKALIAGMKAKYNVELKRIYAVGFSNGGFFVFLVGAMVNEDIAAIYASGGAWYAPPPWSYSHKFPIFMVCGTSDPNLGICQDSKGYFEAAGHTVDFQTTSGGHQPFSQFNQQAWSFLSSHSHP